MTDPTQPTPKPTKSGSSTKKAKVETSIETKPTTETDLERYKAVLLDAQVKGIKSIEVEEDLMIAALKEVSLAVGVDMTGTASFVQNDVIVHLKGTREETEAKQKLDPGFI